MDILKGLIPHPPATLVYGTDGIGKSTWGAAAPNPLVISTEGGLANIDVHKTPICKDFAAVNEALSYLMTQPHQYQTVVIDTLDWLEPLIWRAVATKHGKSNIEDFGYGKGYQLAMDGWNFVLSTLDLLREKGMAVILLAHARVVRFNDPSSDSYDRYEPDLHKHASSRIQEWCDQVLFCTFKVSTVRRDEGFGKERTRAVGSGDRVVYTSEMPTHLAKRRIKLPDVLPLEYAAYAKYLTPSDNGNIEGMVKGGTSKPGGNADVKRSK